jgi:hypothetical protein
LKFLPRLIFYCIVTGLLFNFVKLYFAQNDIELIVKEEVYPWYFRLAFFGNILLTFASISSFALYRKKFPAFVSVCYILILLLVLIASYEDLPLFFQKPTFFYSAKGLGTFANFGLLFFAAETFFFPKLLKLFYYGTFVIIAGSFVILSRMGFGGSRREYLEATRSFAIYLIWVFPYFFLQDNTNKKESLVNTATFFVIMFLILVTGSRSYLIIGLVYLIVKFKAQLQTRNALIGILGTALVLGIGYVVIINSEFSKTLDSVVGNLSERSGEDTRSDQLIDFLNQYDVGYLFQGVGPMGQWYWNGIGSYYSHLDNQILLIAWWAGLPTVLVYVYLLTKSLFVKSEIQLFETIKGLKLIIGLWILACLGFAIYATVSSDLYYYFITLLIGLNACQYSKILDPEEANASIETID